MSELLRERQGHIEILTINRPEARNAINGAVSRGIGGALDELETDDDCWVVILTGAGDKAFSAGMDLKAFAAGEIGDIAGASGGFGGIARRDFSKPIIAALNGSALAWARIWAAVVETGRQADGSVVLPSVLHPYLRGEGVIPAPAAAPAPTS